MRRDENNSTCHSSISCFQLSPLWSGNCWLLALLCPLFFVQCESADFDSSRLDELCRYQLVEWNEDLTEVIVEDIFTPPVASRIYAYPNIAAYEILRLQQPSLRSLVGQLHGLDSLPKATPDVYLPLAAGIAFARVGRALVFGQEKMEAREKEYLEKVQSMGMPNKVYQQSVDYGQQVAAHVIAWAEKDGYLERTAKPQYMLEEDAALWKPTPPAYMPAIEPHWNSLRTFVLDSLQAFRPLRPTHFDTLKGSEFYEESLEVYQVVRQLDEEQTEIAKFWDCNPNVAHVKGHLTFFDQKISPGGHWVSIAGIVIRNEQMEMVESARVLAVLCLTLADAFISCWDEKYNSSVIRPETYINRYIDPDWKPLLQTPAFPEYTSGHSVISSAAANMLTHLIGDQVNFIDSTEVKYGLPARSYQSFLQAADEAAISRLYGGIHYRPAIDNGLDQGKNIGQYIINQLDI
ncbi:MAG: vanadium-dependent haloperoxidase [Bacteroidota bacterium]